MAHSYGLLTDVRSTLDRLLQIRSEYVSVLSKIMAAQFKIYLGAMEKMQMAVATQVDVLGAPEGAGAGAGMLSLFNKGSARVTTVRLQPEPSIYVLMAPVFHVYFLRIAAIPIPCMLNCLSPAYPCALYLTHSCITGAFV